MGRPRSSLYAPPSLVPSAGSPERPVPDTACKLLTTVDAAHGSPVIRHARSKRPPGRDGDTALLSYRGFGEYSFAFLLASIPPSLDREGCHPHSLSPYLGGVDLRLPADALHRRMQDDLLGCFEMQDDTDMRQREPLYFTGMPLGARPPLRAAPPCPSPVTHSGAGTVPSHAISGIWEVLEDGSASLRGDSDSLALCRDPLAPPTSDTALSDAPHSPLTSASTPSSVIVLDPGLSPSLYSSSPSLSTPSPATRKYSHDTLTRTDSQNESGA
ncbi:hypothetical protein B0H10DRAFT_2231823 [Mycena sp. CBHHK59/15]|nr:hypothetical protein B0H10DRAFT_2231823 [Mycena sp. CBHHK59/15]